MNNILRDKTWYDKDNKNIIELDVSFDGQSLRQFLDSLADHVTMYGDMKVGELIESVYSCLGESKPKLAPVAYGYGWPDLRDFSVEAVEDMKDTFTIKINKIYIIHN